MDHHGVQRHPFFMFSKPMQNFDTNKGGGFLINEASAFINNEVFNP